MLLLKFNLCCYAVVKGVAAAGSLPAAVLVGQCTLTLPNPC